MGIGNLASNFSRWRLLREDRPSRINYSYSSLYHRPRIVTLKNGTLEYGQATYMYTNSTLHFFLNISYERSPRTEFESCFHVHVPVRFILRSTLN